jgi:hypothetical protein
MTAPGAARCCEEDGSASTESPTDTVKIGSGAQIVSTITINSDGSCATVNTAATQANIELVHLELIAAAGPTVAVGTVAVTCGITGRGAGAVFSSTAIITLAELFSQNTFDENIAAAVDLGMSVNITDTVGGQVKFQVKASESQFVEPDDDSSGNRNGVAIGIAFWCIALSCIAF